MLRMGSSDEVDSPATDDATPMPIRVVEMGLAATSPSSPVPPTPAAVLGWIAAAGGRAWFPSRHAAETGTDRDSLDDPLAQLRAAGLIEVAEWVRGAGQGYVLTSSGEASSATGLGVPRPLAGAAGATSPAPAPALDSPDPDSGSADRAALRLGLDPRPPLLVPLLLVANLLWFFAGLVAVIRGGYPLGRYLGMDGHPYLLHRLGAVSGPDLLAGEWWRLFSACFVHVGVLHLLVNLFALGMMGPLAELLWGRKRLLVIYALSGLAGSCLAMAHRPDVLLAGASGAIWGVLASLLAWLLLFRSHLPPDVAADWARRLGVVFVLNAGVSLLPGVSWEGHLGGGIAGFLSAGLLNTVRHGVPMRRRALALVCLLALPVACIGGLGAAIRHGEEWIELRRVMAGVAPDYTRRTAAAVQNQARQAAFLAGWNAFNHATGPRLDKLSPDAVKAVQFPAVAVLGKPGDRRNPEVVADLRKALTAMKAVADELVALAPVPTGIEQLDARRAAAREFAEARAKSFSLLLAMLDSPAVPDDAAWTAWGEARRAADAHWLRLSR